MTRISVKYSLILLLVVITFAFIFWHQISNNSKSSVKVDSRGSSDNLGLLSSNENQQDKLLQESTVRGAAQKSGLDFDDNWCNYSEMNESAMEAADSLTYQWLENLGYADAGTDSYFSYQDAILIDLAKNGDLRAMHVLLKSESTDDETKDWAAQEMLIFGGTAQAIVHLIKGSLDKVESLKRRGEFDQVKDEVMDIVASAEYAALRGDYNIYSLRFMENLNQTYQFDEFEISEIQKRGRNFYNDIQSKRADRNLAPLSPPPKIALKFAAMDMPDIRLKGGWLAEVVDSGAIISECEGSQKEKREQLDLTVSR